jgi:hypothetical protein
MRTRARRNVAAPAITASILLGVLGLAGCGGSSSSPSTTSNPASTSTGTSATASKTSRTTTAQKPKHAAPSLAAWSYETQQLCREKRAAVAGLGNVHITYAGIQRVGLPGVKRLLDHYLNRLIGVLDDFSRRQRRIATPASVASVMAAANQVNRQSVAATTQLKLDIAQAGTVSELSQAFQNWLSTTAQLAARGDAAARRLNLPACQSGISASH